jgi:predicted nucleic acid-binding protein
VLEEKGSGIAEDVWDASAQIFVSRIAYPETRAALAAATRAGRLTSSQLRKVKNRFQRIWRQILVIELGELVANAAGDLAERYRLRGYDAVHLSSALTLEDANLVLVSWDRDLRHAGLEIGLRVAPASL